MRNRYSRFVLGLERLLEEQIDQCSQARASA